MDQELNSNCSKTTLYQNLQCLSTSFHFYFSIKNQSFVPNKSLYPDKVSGVTETAECRSLKGVREEEKHGVPPEGRDTSESIDG